MSRMLLTAMLLAAACGDASLLGEAPSTPEPPGPPPGPRVDELMALGAEQWERHYGAAPTPALANIVKIAAIAAGRALPELGYPYIFATMVMTPSSTANATGDLELARETPAAAMALEWHGVTAQGLRVRVSARLSVNRHVEDELAWMMWVSSTPAARCGAGVDDLLRALRDLGLRRDPTQPAAVRMQGAGDFVTNGGETLEQARPVDLFSDSITRDPARVRAYREALRDVIVIGEPERGSPFGPEMIDLRGQPLTPSMIREFMANALQQSELRPLHAERGLLRAAEKVAALEALREAERDSRRRMSMSASAKTSKPQLPPPRLPTPERPFAMVPPWHNPGPSPTDPDKKRRRKAEKRARRRNR